MLVALGRHLSNRLHVPLGSMARLWNACDASVQGRCMADRWRALQLLVLMHPRFDLKVAGRTVAPRFSRVGRDSDKTWLVCCSFASDQGQPA